MQADYIIIAPPEFRQAMAPYVAWRTAQGLSVRVADTQEIYREFADTLGAPGAIRGFVSYALQSWQEPKPQYLLLVGDGDIIPSHRVRSSFADDPNLHEDTVSIDEWYAVNVHESDARPDIAIGRFPVRTIGELAAVVAKTMLFEDSLTRNNYADDFLFLTDRVDGDAFNAAVDDFIATTIPPFYTGTVLRFADTTAGGGTREKLFDALNASTLFFSVYMHGNPFQWSKDAYMTAADVPALAANRRPFILTSAACSQNFDTGNDSVLVKRLLTHPNGGAVATFASTGLSYLLDDNALLGSFYRSVFAGRGGRIGSHILAAKRDAPSYGNPAHGFDHNTGRYTLLGDPALRLPRDLVTTAHPIADRVPAGFSLGQNYPNPFNPSTRIGYRLPAATHVTLTVYDMLGRVAAVLVNGMRQAGAHEAVFNAHRFASGTYMYRLEAGDYRAVKKMTLVK